MARVGISLLTLVPGIVGGSETYARELCNALDRDLVVAKHLDVLAQLAKETGATQVHCIRHFEPWWRKAEEAVAETLDLVCHDESSREH